MRSFSSGRKPFAHIPAFQMSNVTHPLLGSCRHVSFFFFILIWECLLLLVAQGTFTCCLKSNPGTQKVWLILLTGISKFSSRPQFPFPILYNKGKIPTGKHSLSFFHWCTSKYLLCYNKKENFIMMSFAIEKKQTCVEVYLKRGWLMIWVFS